MLGHDCSGDFFHTEKVDKCFFFLFIGPKNFSSDSDWKKAATVTSSTRKIACVVKPLNLLKVFINEYNVERRKDSGKQSSTAIILLVCKWIDVIFLKNNYFKLTSQNQNCQIVCNILGI